MSIDWNAVFNTIYDLKAKRDVVFREATSYALESAAVTYASDATLPAKVLWRDDSLEFQRGRGGAVWQETDRGSLVIWFKDLTGNPTATSTEVGSYISRFKGAVNEAFGEYFSRFIVDGQYLKARAVIPIERPDGKIYALKILIQAAE